jgi:D-alanyl-D-alanine carboxypeptidase/D-alanyl-D-alanine-endopeptidase (penicillin-binding protein 4)
VELRVKRLLLAAAFLFAGCATVQPNPFDKLMSTPPLDHAVWGVLIEEDDGRVIYERNAHQLFMPASNRKLFSAATDANCIGLTTRLKTELWIDGGDVIIKGEGDPSFGAERHESPGFAPFVEALKSRGITQVRDVIADVSRFDRVTVVPSWEVGDLPDDYAAPVDAIAYEENVIGEIAVVDPAINAAMRFRDALRDAGIRVNSTIRTNPVPRDWAEKIATVESPMVAQLLYSVLEVSQNLYAETLFKRSSADGTYEEAQRVERDFLTNEVHIDPNEFYFSDGSGLTRRDLVAPAATVKLLRWMNAPERRGVWWLMLAKPAGDGTLRRRLVELAPRLRGKTGTLTGVNTLSGVIAGANGRYRYFSIMVNHHLSGQSTKTLDAMVREIAKF